VNDIKNDNTQREQLEMGVHNALWDLSNYFKERNDPLQYEINRLYHQFDHLRNVPDFPNAKR